MKKLENFASLLFLLSLIQIYPILRFDVMLNSEYESLAIQVGLWSAIPAILTFMFIFIKLLRKSYNEVRRDFRKRYLFALCLFVPFLISANIANFLTLTLPYGYARLFGEVEIIEFNAKKRIDYSSSKDRRKYNVDIIDGLENYTELTFPISEERYNKLPYKFPVTVESHKTSIAIAVSDLSF